jgi:hypothetical protein
MTEFLIELIGWLGAALLLLAYALISSKRLTANTLSYQGLNIIGGVMLAANSLYRAALPSVFVNVVWIIIGAVAIFNLWRSTAGKPNQS